MRSIRIFGGFIIVLAFVLCGISSCENIHENPGNQSTGALQQTPNSTFIKLDSSKREKLIERLSEMLESDSTGQTFSGSLLKYEMSANRLFRVSILTDSGKVVSIPNVTLQQTEVNKLNEAGTQVTVTIKLGEHKDTSVVFFSALYGDQTLQK